MAPSGSKTSSTCGENGSAEEDSKASSMSGEDVSAEGDSKASSMPGERLKYKEDKLKEAIEALKAENTTLKAENTNLKAENTNLKAQLSEKAKRIMDVSTEEDSRAFSVGGEVASADDYTDDSNSTASPAANSKLVKHPENGRLFRGPKLDVGVWSTLDDYLLEKIIARLPFKLLFQASSLSKTWRDRFCTHAFQREVQHSSASSWKSYSPLFVNNKKDLVGYDSSSEQWHRLPTHSYVHQNVVWGWVLRAGAGPLLCWTDNGRHLHDVHVTNPLMRSWKQLPPRPKMHVPELVHLSWEGGSKAYKVILGSRETLCTGRLWIHVQIFNSTNDSWTMESYCPVTNFNGAWAGSVFISGVFYMLGYKLDRRYTYALISFDVKEKTWKEIPQLSQAFDDDLNPRHQFMTFYDVYFSDVLVCGSTVMLVVLHREKASTDDFASDSDIGDEEYVLGEQLSVYRLDLKVGLAFEVSRASEAMWNELDTYPVSASGQGDCIYIGGDCPSQSSMLYNVGAREWRWVNLEEEIPPSFSGAPMHEWQRSSVAYQPGLNPFLGV